MVGQNLVPELRLRGDHVVALDRNRHNLDILSRRVPGVTAHAEDLAEPGDWEELFAGVDAVVDLKAQITSHAPEPHERNNVVAGRRVLDACQRHGVPHLVHLSSSVVISVSEDVYTRSKRAAERAVLESSVPHTVLRPPLLYGHFDVKHIGLILSLLRRWPALPIPGDGRYPRQPLFVGDLCRAILAVLDRPPEGRVHDVIGHERIAFVELLRRAAALAGLRAFLVPTPLPLYRLALGAVARLTGRPPFTREQLDALVAGDDFPVGNWAEELGVRYTPFGEAAPWVFGSPPPEWGEMASTQ